MAENVTAITDSNFQTEVLDASRSTPVMVDFWAEWCRPCLMLAPTVGEIASEFSGKVKVFKMNVDENPDFPNRFQIRSIPTLLVFKDGKVAEQIVGLVPKEQIAKALNARL
jgi:thioredoxin 1